MKLLLLCSIFYFMSFVSDGFCSPLSTQAEIIPTLTAPEVKNIIDSGDVLLINTLSSIEFEIQHIPTSINIPVVTMKDTDALPKDKNSQLIFYCMGVR